MTLQQLFLNTADMRLRSGWRMALFIVVFGMIDTAVIAIVARLFTATGLIRSMLMMTALTYAVVLFVTWAMCTFIDGRPLAAVGLGFHDRTLLELAQGLGLGAVLMSAIFAANLLFGFATFSFKPLSIGEITTMTSWAVAEFTVVAVGEELLFRGYLFQTLVEGSSRLIAVCVFSVFFAVVHIGNPNATAFSLCNIALAGVWLAAAYFKTRGLWLPFGLHFSWNFFQNHVFAFPVSGMTMPEKQLGVLIDHGPSWLTGGTFGPEGGALGTIALIAGTVLIWYAPHFRPSASAWIRESRAHEASDGSATLSAVGEGSGSL